MTRTNAIGSGPVLFFGTDGIMIDVPLDKIHFDDGVVGLHDFTITTPIAKLPAWLAFLAQRGDLKAAEAPPGVKALVATAREGAGGNHVTITVASGTATNRVDITVTQTDIYEGLTLATLNARLGIGTTAGTSVGLLRVATGTNAPGAPDPVDQPDVPAGGTATAPTWTIADSNPAGAPVVLEPKLATGFDRAKMKVSISDVQAATGGATFTLTTVYKITKADVVFGTATFPTLTEFNYLVALTAPPGPAPTGGYKPPRPGTTALLGGRDVTAAVAATASLLAD